MRTLPAIFSAASALLLSAPVAFAADGENTPVNVNSTGGSAATAHSASGGSIVRTIFGLLVVLAVIYGLHWVLKQVKASKDGRAAGSGLSPVATLPLGSHRSL